MSNNSTIKALILASKDSRDLEGRVEYTVDINRSLASILLKARDNQQRHLSASRVLEIRSDIENGKWMNTGDAIRLGPQGTMVDGQHRLTAYLSAKTKNPLVLRDVTVLILKDSKSLSVLDSGKSRTVNDLRKITGHPPVSAKAIGGIIYEHRNFDTSGVFSKTQQIALVNNHPLLDRVVDLSVPHKGISIALTPVIAAAIRCMRIPDAKDIAFKFFDSVLKNSHTIDGVHVQQIEVLTNWLLRNRSKSGHAIRRETVVRCIRAWNAYREGRAITALRYVARNEIPQPK